MQTTSLFLEQWHCHTYNPYSMHMALLHCKFKGQSPGLGWLLSQGSCTDYTAMTDIHALFGDQT